MANKYKFRKIFINCVNGKALESDVLSADFFANEDYATKILLQNGYQNGEVVKQFGTNKNQKHTVEAFYLVPAKLYNEILKKFEDDRSVNRFDVFYKNLVFILKNNNIWKQHKIDVDDVIRLENDVIWVNLDGLPKDYQSKFIFPNFTGYIEMFLTIIKPASVADQRYYFNYIYNKKSKTKSYIFK